MTITISDETPRGDVRVDFTDGGDSVKHVEFFDTVEAAIYAVKIIVAVAQQYRSADDDTRETAAPF